MSKIKKFNKPIVAVMLITAIIFSMCSQLFTPMLATAATVEKTKLHIRTSTNYKYMNNWAYPNERHGIHLATVAEGDLKGEPVYCIEFGKDMGDDGQTETVMDIEKVPAWEEFNATQKNGITRATIYGYPNYNYGVSNEAAQVATQFVVWEYSQGYRTSADGSNPTAGLNGTSSKIEDAIESAKFDVRQQYYKSGVKEYSDVEKAYKGILNGIKNHKTVPSFNSDTVELKWSSTNNRYEAKISDNNSVLSEFDFKSGNSNLKFSKSGNTLTVYSTAVIKNETSVTMTKTNTTVGADVGFVPADKAENQSLVGRLTDPVITSFKVKTASGNLKLIKTSEDGKVSGIKFTITGDNYSKTATTDSNGTFLLENIPAGTYTVTEESIDRYEPQKTQTVKVVGGETATVSFSNKLKRGDLTVIKTAEDGLVSGVKFHLYGTSLAGIKVDEYAVTNSKGIATFKDILIGTGYALEEVDTAIRYVVPDDQPTTIEWNKVTNSNVENILKKFRVIVKKTDSKKGNPQGDATLAGAIYGIYKDGNLIDTYTTDAKGQFTTKYYICGENWTIKEISPSEGYLLDETVHKVGADPKLYKVEYNTTSNDVIEDVIYGKISIIKHSDDGSTQIETPEKGAEFQIYLKSSGSYAKADKDERDTIVCDEDGFGSSKLLPYGVYTVHQTKGWEGRELIADFDVFINTNNQTYKFLINNSNFESYVKVVKADAETGKTIPYAGAGFEIYDTEGHRITMQFTYPQVTSIHTFYTNSEGYLITPETLPYGDYKLKEVQAPYGYVLDSTPIPFSITQENSSTDTGVTVVMVKAKDVPQKGVIEITKSGEVFATVENSENIYTPIYELKNLANAVFQIYAAEDIVTLDGTVRAYQGELVDEIKTGKDGIAKSKELYLGKYTVIEKTAPDTFFNANEQHDVELTYAGQDVKVTSTALSVYNERQRVTLSLSKIMEQNETFGMGMNGEILSVQFGIFANEEIKALDGTIIPADALITTAFCNENGNITFDCDLPIGYKFYAKEIATDEHYILSDTKYEFETEYQGQNVDVYEIKINDGESIENELIYGNIKGLKIDRETEETIEGALFGLFNSDETEFTEGNAILTSATDENGIFSFENVPFGAWLIKEIHPAENYLPSNDIYHVQISNDEQIIEITVVNDLIPEIKTTATVDGEKEICATEVFTLTDTVEYKHLIPGKEYVVKGVLMDKTTGKPLIIDGAEVHSETVFIPTEPSGTVTVEFTFDSKYIKADTDIVVFETLYRDNAELTVHADIEDEGQTVKVKVPTIKTKAEADGKKDVEAKGEITIDDIVSYSNLTVGKEYVIKGVLMDKTTGKPFKVNDKEITSEVKFIPETSDGEVTVSFTFDASGIKKSTELVVFETLYRDDVEIAVHADIDDEGQTVKITVPTVPSISTPKTGDYRNSGIWFGIGAIALGGAVSAVILKIKSKKGEDED